MGAATRYRFDPFELDTRRRRLLRDGVPIALTTRAFDTLLALLERRGDTVDKDALMRRLWPDTVVEEGNLTQQISTVRRALGEAPDDHRYIVTVARRGYRFVAEVTAEGDAPDAAATVGREREVGELDRAFEAAQAGSGLLLCVHGEPGIGKSTLIDRWLRSVAGRCLALSGRCSERLAPGEPYLPVLEALEDWLRRDASAAEAMAARAPSWLVQVAPHAGAAAPPGMSQERRQRELAALCLDLSQRTPLVLFVDDLQWADVSTLDLLVHLATRVDAARVLIVAAYRQSELLRLQPAFVQSLRDLRARGRARELAPALLTRDEVTAFVDAACRPHGLPPDVVSFFHARTEGHPLFLADLFRDWRERGVIAQTAGRWTMTRPLADVAREVPASVRGMIERTIDRLDAPDRQILVAGSVQGLEFDSAVVARALGLDAAVVEERLDILDRVHALVRLAGEYACPDGTPNLRYAFVHVLHQDALSASLVPSRKAALSGAMADALCAIGSGSPLSTAHRLALLYEAARRPVEAADAFLLAARHAVAVSAGREAAALARRGLDIASTLPPTPDNLARELQLLITLGVPLAATTGYGNPEVERAYTRARALCEELDEPQALFPVLWGLWVLYHVRANLAQALDAANHLLALGERTGDRRALEVAHTLLGYTRGHLGDLDAALEHLEQAERFGDPSHHEFYRAVNAMDAGVAALCQQGRVLALMGHADRAVASTGRALALARSLGIPNAIGFALVWTAYVRQLRGERAAVRELAGEALALAADHGLADVRGWAAVLAGWAGDDPIAGAGMIRESLAGQRSFGSEIARPHQLGLLAEVLVRGGDAAGALAVVDEALAEAARTGDRYYEPHLRRLRGELAGAGTA